LVGPKAPDEGEIDLEDFFWRQRPYFYGALLATVILSLIDLDFLKTPNVALFVRQNLTVLPMLIPTVLALVSRTRWVQWAAGLCFLAITIGYTVEFCSTLS